MRVVHNILGKRKMARGKNASFIFFILKVDNPQHLNDFRPISLVGLCTKLCIKSCL